MGKSLSKKTVIIVLVLFLTLSVGYALFSETITIEGTATAKGSFDIEATCTLGPPTDIYNHFGYDLPPNVGFKNDSCFVDDQTVTFSTELEYPGAGRGVTVTFENTGTMDAFIELDDGAFTFMTYYPDFKITDVSTGEVVDKSKFDSKSLNWLYTSSFYKMSDGIYLGLDADSYLENNLLYIDSSGTEYLKVSPGKTLIMYCGFVWNDKWTYQGYNVESSITFPFEFVQLKSDMQINPNGEVCFTCS